MKLLLGLFLVPGLCLGQQKRDTKILVTISDTVSVFNRLALALYDAGYSLEQKDKELGFISTNEKTLNEESVETKIHAQIKGNQVLFTGFFKLTGKVVSDEGNWTPIFYQKNNSFNKRAWNEIISIAKQFGTEIEYSK